MKRKIGLLAFIVALSLSAAPVCADGEFYVIAGSRGVGTPITSLPYTITKPGFYYLNGNLTCDSGNGITVNVNDVTIDLMGFLLTGNNTGSGIYMYGRKNVEIRNGSLKTWRNGIIEADPKGTAVNLRVTNVHVEANTQAIFLWGSWHLVKGCTVESGSQYAISAGPNQPSTVTGNMVNGCDYGINAFGSITGNVVNNCKTGILITGSCTVIGNTVLNYESSQTGMQIATGSDVLIDQNSVSGPGTHYIAGNATVFGTNAGR